MLKKGAAIIFGGSGFVGGFFAQFLIDVGYEKIFVCDILPPKPRINQHRLCQLIELGKIVYINADIRSEIPQCLVGDVSISLIANFSAIHREPGHEDLEYFDTNIRGAENICKYAAAVGCQTIIFSSSISPYGVSELVKDESTLPVPVTAYGSSKLVAEKIHEIWQARDAANRRLVIVRPGVVFGPGEGGNVSRLIKAVTGRYFFYMGNQSTRKAGIYVKELCYAMWWVLQKQIENGERISLFNMSMNPAPTVSEYVQAICKVQGIHRFTPGIPYKVLICAAHIIDVLARFFGIKHPFSPVRIRKLIRSNNVMPNYLINRGYHFQYSLFAAFTDWKESSPEDWE